MFTETAPSLVQNRFDDLQIKMLWVKIKLFLVFQEKKIEIFILSSAFLLECSGEKFFNPSLALGPVETGYFGWAVVTIDIKAQSRYICPLI